MPTDSLLFATDPDERLLGGSGPHEGRVEVYHNGTWGTVCDDGWDLQDATVVCRQLGYFNATAALGSTSFGAGSGPIFHNNLSCSGNESHITMCPNHGSADLNCTHSEDAGVICEGESAALCVCLCVCVCLSFHWLEGPARIDFCYQCHPQRHVVRLPASNTALLQNWLFSAENS